MKNSLNTSRFLKKSLLLSHFREKNPDHLEHPKSDHTKPWFISFQMKPWTILYLEKCSSFKGFARCTFIWWPGNSLNAFIQEVKRSGMVKYGYLIPPINAATSHRDDLHTAESLTTTNPYKTDNDVMKQMDSSVIIFFKRDNVSIRGESGNEGSWIEGRVGWI